MLLKPALIYYKDTAKGTQPVSLWHRRACLSNIKLNIKLSSTNESEPAWSLLIIHIFPVVDERDKAERQAREEAGEDYSNDDGVEDGI